MDPRKILTLEDFTRGGGSPTERLIRQQWPFWVEQLQRPEGLTVGIRAYVEVNHGRWIVNCPLPDFSSDTKKCHGAQMASRMEHRFFCVECLHRDDERARGHWIAVVWPSAKTVAKIEAALLRRPVENRHWLPSEELHLLLAENAAFMGEEHLKALSEEWATE